ncbi:MAG: MBL fold metallo-hydrolase [Candidatus Heimdallarchaeota archaeon]|nr:MAG: MBL fold metallo-hydrolase [Candidatus Heimdallarchaeota archaeon]
MDIFNVGKNIVVANTSNIGSNIVCINTDEGLVFIDTGLIVEKVKKFRQDMEKKFNKKTIYLVLTHAHQDHIFGMKSFFDVPIISSQACKDKIKERLATDFTGDGIRKILEYYSEFKEYFANMGISEDEITEVANLTDVVVEIPQIGFKKEHIIGKDENKIVIKTSGGHSLDSATIYISTEKVLITGDEFYHSQVPLFAGMPESHENWLKTIKSWEKLDVMTVIPGHGSPIDFDYVVNARKFVEKTFKIIRELKEKNIEADKAIRDERLKDYYGKSNWKDPSWWKESLKALYQML